MYVSIKKTHITNFCIAYNVVLKILLKKVSKMTIVMPVFHVIISVSIVSSVSIISRASFCNASFVNNVCIVFNCKYCK